MSTVLMGFVGDVFVNRSNPAEVFSRMREILAVPHIVFGNLEGPYADHARPVPSASPTIVRGMAHNLDIFADVGFNVMSMANNHIVDAGFEAMLENRTRLRARGVKTCGAGDSLVDAHEPAILQADGLRIAFLAYACTFPMGYEAHSNVPGIAAMRAYNFWREPYPTMYSPGIYPLVTTLPDEVDLAMLTDDIRKARERADLVVSSFHWGDYTSRFHLTDHETRTARYCIDQGADLVLGHHHHTLRGMEWYKGKPIMYGLGHFVFDMSLNFSNEEFRNVIAGLGPDVARYFLQAHTRGIEWPFPLREETRLTLMAWATASEKGISAIGFLPCRLAHDGSVHPLRLHSAESDQVVNYVKQCNGTQGLNSRIVPEGATRLGEFQTLRIVPA